MQPEIYRCQRQSTTRNKRTDEGPRVATSTDETGINSCQKGPENSGARLPGPCGRSAASSTKAYDAQPHVDVRVSPSAASWRPNLSSVRRLHHHAHARATARGRHTSRPAPPRRRPTSAPASAARGASADAGRRKQPTSIPGRGFRAPQSRRGAASSPDEPACPPAWRGAAKPSESGRGAKPSARPAASDARRRRHQRDRAT